MEYFWFKFVGPSEYQAIFLVLKLRRVVLYRIPKDSHIAKLTVLLAFILETVQTTMFTRDLFKGLTLDYEAWNLFQIDQVNTVWISVPLITCLSRLQQHSPSNYNNF